MFSASIIPTTQKKTEPITQRTQPFNKTTTLFHSNQSVNKQANQLHWQWIHRFEMVRQPMLDQGRCQSNCVCCFPVVCCILRLCRACYVVWWPSTTILLFFIRRWVYVYVFGICRMLRLWSKTYILIAFQWFCCEQCCKRNRWAVTRTEWIERKKVEQHAET